MTDNHFPYIPPDSGTYISPSNNGNPEHSYLNYHRVIAKKDLFEVYLIKSANSLKAAPPLYWRDLGLHIVAKALIDR